MLSLREPARLEEQTGTNLAPKNFKFLNEPSSFTMDLHNALSVLPWAGWDIEIDRH
jgi:hypothetical protein